MTLESSLILLCFENNVQLLLSICLLSLELHISNEIARSSILKIFEETADFQRVKTGLCPNLDYDLSV